jgi:hypothetical protein
VERFWLTASGGPFRTWDASRIANARIEDALKHPTWKMGGKITIDSASLVNKGLEVIEAHRLFEAPMDRISIMVHPQSLLHGAVSFTDGSMKAQIGAPDMRVPISYAMNYPQRSEQPARAVSLADMRELTFEEPDLQRFPGLAVALAGRHQRHLLLPTTSPPPDSHRGRSLSEASPRSFAMRAIASVDVPPPRAWRHSAACETRCTPSRCSGARRDRVLAAPSNRSAAGVI